MSGLIRPVLDLTRNAWKQRHGDIDVYGTWFWDEDDSQWVPCLCLVRATTVLHWERVRPCLIPLDHAWAWSEEKGDDAHVAVALGSFINALGLPADAKSAIRVLGLIRDHLEDLVKRVPPRPADDRETTVTADATVKIDGHTSSTEIRDRV